jgi:hypothetical protein
MGRVQYYQDFWPFFLEQHSKPLTKKLHFIGTLTGLFLAVFGIIRGEGFWILLAPIVGYSFAWYSHFFVEKNRPATFRYPIWSFISELRMTWLVLRGKI